METCIKSAFDGGYTYAGLQEGGFCWGSKVQIGKYGESDKCNYKCPDGKTTCGGKGANTAFKIDYLKDKLCDVDWLFEELADDGSVNFGNGGRLRNPSKDGERFFWAPRVEGDPFNMTAVRSKSGDVKGFKLFPDNPF